MNSNGKLKSRKANLSTKLSKLKSNNDHLSFLAKEGTVLFSKARNSTLYLTSVSNSHNLTSNIHASTMRMNSNRNKANHSQLRNDSLFKVKEENQKLLAENIYLKEKLNIAEQSIEKRYQMQMNAIVNDNRYETLLSQSQRLLEVLIDVTEVFFFQTKGINRDITRMMNCNNNNDNISFSIDVYEPSISNDDDKRVCLLDQIQSLVLFKLKVFHDQFGIDIDGMKGKIREWNKIDRGKDKENNSSNSISFSNISQIKSKAQQNVINENSLSYSEYNTSSNINVPLSPKFCKDEASDFCKSLNESEIKGFNDKEDEQMKKYSFTEDPKLLNYNSTFKSIHIKDNEQEQEPEPESEQAIQNDEHKASGFDGEEEKVLHTFNNDNDEEHTANIWNNHIEISFEGKIN